MADTIQIDTGALTNCANQMDQARQRMISIADDATSTITSLGNTWSGNAADAFRNSWSSSRNKLDNAASVISQYVNYLNTTIAEYEAAEAERASDNASQEGGQ